MRTKRNSRRGRTHHTFARNRARTRRQPRRRLFKTLFWLAVTVPILVIFAPVQIGGQIGYIIVSGTSMLPNYEYNDLVLTWSAPEYTHGDVIAYHDPILGGVVFHRIVGIEGNQFQTQGDNNTWLDLYRPYQEDIVGKAWIQIPGAGEYVLLLNQPGPFSMIVTAFVLIIFIPSQQSSRRKIYR
jgi:signal peptidase I